MIIRRELGIDAGHRIAHHGGMCRGLHGHRYRVVVTLHAEEQGCEEERDMAIDFGRLKQIMMAVIHDTCDHSLILECTDPLLETLGVETMVTPEHEVGRQQIIQSESGRIVVLPNAPTAERLAEHWGVLINDMVSVVTRRRVRLEEIEVWETPNCSAVWRTA